MDISKLENIYHILPAPGMQALDAYDADHLRVLDSQVDEGVKAVFDDDSMTIVAFLFARGAFTEEQARQWLDQAEENGVNLTALAGDAPVPFDLSTAQPIAAEIEELSFADIYRLLGEALDTGEIAMPDGSYRYAWLLDVYPEYCIVEVGARYYQLPYWMDDDGKIAFGEPSEVRKQYVPVSTDLAAGIQGGQGHVFTLHLRAVPDAVRAELDADDDGLIWKEIFRVSTTFRGDGEPLIVTQDMVDAIASSFGMGVVDNVAVTARDHFIEEDGIVPAEATDGFVRKLVQEGESLYAGMEIIKADVREGIEDGTIVDCSVYVWGGMVDRKSGQTWPWVLIHLLLTNYPQLPDLGPFGAKPASIAASNIGATYYASYREVTTMAEQTQPNAAPAAQVAISPADQALLAELKALQQEGFSLDQIKKQQKALKTQARDLEVGYIVAALEGHAKRNDVVNVEGCRHYPAVIVAAEKLLRSEPAIAASVTQQGTSPVDRIVLAILNALPQEARLRTDDAPDRPSRESVAAQAAPQVPAHRTTPLTPEQAKAAAENLDAVDQFLGELGRKPAK